MYDDIRQEGRLAAAQGIWKLGCPYLRRDKLPTYTHEPLGRWLANVRAWEDGWKAGQLPLQH
ncbi:hypothetical protein LMG1866_03776 [Achromobacter ruhlandii]|jgi:hypothetical protein|uniref:CrpP-related protein n=1 Tax=Achromobacter ruhlandii TaxID=72557 RepID=UPI0014699B5E|nr:hypothetical protein LMG1866_03776 [Achromobacter ruhlandii]